MPTPTTTALMKKHHHKRWISWAVGAATGTDSGWEKREDGGDDGLERWITCPENPSV